jgi:two-component system, chemotaxis family, protein-glutamate methylesterase/glutaminase
MRELIRALIVDDSAFVRKVVREMLSRSPYIEVIGAARDGHEALEMVEELKPDVITCDLMMPGLNGVGFVREQLARRPVPILILTSSPQDGELAIEALEAGAVDFIQKPSALATNDIQRIREDLIEKVKAASRAPVALLKGGNGAHKPVDAFVPRSLKVDIVLIGISTGGPQALRKVIPQLPGDFPVPLAIVLHMPTGYTKLYAEKLDEISQIRIKEANDGDVLQPGHALLAQAGRHLTFRRAPGGHIVAQLTMQPFDALHRPSVDVLFQSAAELYKDRILGVVMTGMGSDGTQGAAWIKAKGGRILTEAEESCVIYGMPRAVVESHLSDLAVPLGSMAKAIMDQL